VWPGPNASSSSCLLSCAVSGGRSRLHLIDLGSCVKALGKNREGGSGLCLSLSALGNVILALVNGSKHIPYK
jgi:kinesin family protein 26